MDEPVKGICECCGTPDDFLEQYDGMMVWGHDFVFIDAGWLCHDCICLATSAEEEKLVTIASRQNSRAKKQKRDGIIYGETLRGIYLSQNGRCYWCGASLGPNWHTDHRVPLCKGGSNQRTNIVIACPRCNREKGKKLPIEWLSNNRGTS